MSNYKGYPICQARKTVTFTEGRWQQQPTGFSRRASCSRRRARVRTGRTTSGHRRSDVGAADPDARRTREPHSL